MILTHVKIRNFRSISSLELCPKQITTFIGKNSCGKSNILRALQFFFTTSVKSASEEDICKFADDKGTWVECTFDNLSDKEREDLDKYLRYDGTIRIRRTIYKDGDRCTTKLHGYETHAAEIWLQPEYAEYADMAKWQALGIDVSQYAPLGAKGKLTKEGFKEFRKRYMADKGSTLTLNEQLSTTEFKGRQSTAASVLPNFIFIPAVGDIVSVIYGKQSSLLNEMVASVIEAAKSHDEYALASASLVSAQEFVNPSPRRLGKLALIEEDLKERLSSWPGTKVQIRTEVDDLAKILVGGLILKVDDGHDTDLSEKGDGIQRQILFRIFQLFADFRAQRGVFKPEEGQPAIDRGPSIIAFEEPELFLHPQAQEKFYDDLLTVSEHDQVLLATHSSYLVRLEQAGSLHIVVRPSPTDPTRVKTVDPNWLETGTARRDHEKRFKQMQLCSGEVNKIFFADRVVVTEGQEDMIYILGTARDHTRCIDRRVTVVEVNGKGSIPTLQLVLNAFGIPYVVACDEDPGNVVSQKQTAEITALIAEANRKHDSIARLELFSPDLPSVCTGVPTPQAKHKPFEAHQFIQNEKPSDAFCERVKKIFSFT